MKKKAIAFGGMAAAGLTTGIALAEAAGAATGIGQSVMAGAAVGIGCMVMVYGFGRMLASNVHNQ